MIIACPKCHARYQLADDFSADKVRCKKCQEIITVKESRIVDSGISELKTAVLSPAAGAKTVVPGAAASKPPAVMPQLPFAAKTIAPGQPPSSAAAKTIAPASPPSAAMKTIAPKPATSAGQKPAPTGPTRITGERTAAEKAQRQASAAQQGGDEDDPLIGATLGGYHVLRKLGQGGMGAVYEARQIALDRSVALKVLPSALAANKSFIHRFTREALSVAKLNHNNIIQIYDVGKEGDTYFFAMEFVRGKTLQKMVEESGKMEIDTAVRYIVQAARGLEYAHHKNIVHRDIKPDNIMINEEGVAKVADLGLAKDVTDAEASVTMSGVGMGTPHYMAPEQATDAKTADGRADIYSLGCTLYQLVTGRVPYTGNSAYEIITKHVTEPVTLPNLVNPDVSAELSAIIVKMMAKKRDDRYMGMSEVVAALEGYLGVDFARKGFHPSEAQIATLKAHAARVKAVRADMASRTVVFCLIGLSIITAVIGLFAGFRLIIGVLEFAVIAPLTYATVKGMGRKTYGYRRIRSYVFGYRISDWIVAVVMVLVAIGLIIMLNLKLVTFSAVVLGLCIGLIYRFALRKPVESKVAAEEENLNKFIRELRRKGIPEEEIHLFICRNADDQGEFLCEEIFGRDALIHARNRMSEDEMAKRPAGVRLREWLIRRLDAVETRRAVGKELVRPIAETAQKVIEEQAEAASHQTAKIIMPEAGSSGPVHAQSVSSAHKVDSVIVNQFLDQLDHKPSAMKQFLADLPWLIFGPRGRIIIGSIMLLIAIAALRQMAFGQNRVLASYNFALLSFAVICSGFARSKVFHGGIILCAVVVIVPFFSPEANNLLTQSLSEATARVPVIGNMMSSLEKGVGTEVMKQLTPPFFVGAFLLVMGFIGQIIWGHR